MHQPRLSRKECDLPCRSFSAIPHAEKRTGFRLRMEEKKLPRLRDEAGRWTRRSSAMPMRERELPPATERQRGMQTLSSHPRTPRTGVDLYWMNKSINGSRKRVGGNLHRAEDGNLMNMLNDLGQTTSTTSTRCTKRRKRWITTK